MRPRGAIAAALLVPERPLGFVDDRHFFTLNESDLGLLQVRIWSFERVCDERE